MILNNLYKVFLKKNYLKNFIKMFDFKITVTKIWGVQTVNQIKLV